MIAVSVGNCPTSCRYSLRKFQNFKHESIIFTFHQAFVHLHERKIYVSEDFGKQFPLKFFNPDAPEEDVIKSFNPYLF